MPHSADVVVVASTVPDLETGRRIARALVEERLAACVNIVPRVISIYRWEGDVTEDDEALLVIKTRGSLFDALAARVATLHPYEVPEIVALPLAGGSAPYLDWVRDATGPDPGA